MSPLLLALVLSAVPAAPQGAHPDQATGSPVARVVLFHSPLCRHCQAVMSEDLPPLRDRWGESLEILEVDVTAEGGLELYRSTVRSLGIPDDRVGVPAIVVGSRILVGSEEIPARLPGLVEASVADGGIGWPDIPGLREYRAAREEARSATGSVDAVVAAPDPALEGGLLAWGVLGLLLAALVRGARAGWRGWSGPGGLSIRPAATSFPWLAVALAMGTAVAGYLSWTALSNTTAVCGPLGDCGAVHASPYSRIFGVPVAFLGLLGYLGLILLWSHPRGLARWPGTFLSLALAGALASLYLTAMELFVIRAVCMWCLASAAAMAAILWMVAGRTVPVRPA